MAKWLPAGTSHGDEVARKYGITGARGEAAAGFPSVFEVGYPVLVRSLAATRSTERALFETFFTLLVSVEDSNIYYRGGPEGMSFARSSAERFLVQGGTAKPDWRDDLTRIHREFVDRARRCPVPSPVSSRLLPFVHWMTSAVLMASSAGW